MWRTHKSSNWLFARLHQCHATCGRYAVCCCTILLFNDWSKRMMNEFDKCLTCSRSSFYSSSTWLSQFAFVYSHTWQNYQQRQYTWDRNDTVHINKTHNSLIHSFLQHVRNNSNVHLSYRKQYHQHQYLTKHIPINKCISQYQIKTNKPVGPECPFCWISNSR